MKQRVPIIKLTKSEKVWLEAVYLKNQQGQRFTFKDVWAELHNLLPAGFRPSDMDERLISSNGEEIRFLGVIAIEKNLSIIKKTDSVINAIRKIILKDPRKETITINEIEEKTGLKTYEISFIMHMVNSLQHFYNSSSYDNQDRIIKSIGIGGDEGIFYRYIRFPGIKKLLELQAKENKTTDTDKFTADETVTLNNRIDQLLKDLESLKVGQEIIWTDMMEEISELKNLYFLSKKNWRQLLTGKLSEMVIGGVISETVSKKIAEYINPVFDKLLTD
ncbi:MAG TPA: hypothetical protein VK483_04405 [Chitinophagaceae bacterium]|nr:hypothetical protein [Chitinophagaceae bacterium]